MGHDRGMRWGRVGRSLALLLAACGTDEGIPEGKLARVGDVVFGPEDVAAVSAQLGAYAQLRFAGGDGHGALLAALVDAEVLAQEAIRQGLGEDPRVEYALLEEVAGVYLSAELERRVPYAEVAADSAALRAWLDAHPDAFVEPEQRSAEGVVFERWIDAERAMAALDLGAVQLDELGELLKTPLQARDDHEFPGFHVVLFDPALRVGDRLPQPVTLGERLFVGRVHEVVPARRGDLDDPAVRERVVQAVREPRLAAARAALLEELAARFPEQG